MVMVMNRNRKGCTECNLTLIVLGAVCFIWKAYSIVTFATEMYTLPQLGLLNS